MRTRLIADMHSFVYGPVAEDYRVEDKCFEIPGRFVGWLTWWARH